MFLAERNIIPPLQSFSLKGWNTWHLPTQGPLPLMVTEQHTKDSEAFAWPLDSTLRKLWLTPLIFLCLEVEEGSSQ